jgi:hypothetical protein
MLTKRLRLTVINTICMYIYTYIQTTDVEWGMVKTKVLNYPILLASFEIVKLYYISILET